MQHDVGAVSYTHLDVYKRQVGAKPRRPRHGKRPVSYTHLDVYKRQEHAAGADGGTGYADRRPGAARRRVAVDAGRGRSREGAWGVGRFRVPEFPAAAVPHRTGAVSCTHLDVYKRQRIRSRADQRE